jgi:hypothetical protein
MAGAKKGRPQIARAETDHRYLARRGLTGLRAFMARQA